MNTIQAALYARVSSEQQTNAKTIASQLAALRERMGADDCLPTVEMEFVDEGWSGATLMRPALERLRDTVALGGIDRLYVHSPDRLARKYAYQVVLIDELQRAGVEIVFINHALGHTAEENLLLQVQGMVAEYERAKIIERSRRGKRYKAQNGQISALGGAPYGYRYITVSEGSGCARYDIVAEHAQIVQQIFHWVGQDRATIREVCLRLQNQQIPSPTGRSRWDPSTVCGLLKNTAYAGHAAFGKTRVTTPQTGLRPYRRQHLPLTHTSAQVLPDEWISIPVPPLIDADLFANVQAQLQENRERARSCQRGARYLLQGLVVCKQCGYAYYGKPIKRPNAQGHERHYAYYRCTGSDASHFGGQRVCTNRPVRMDCLDQAVWQEVRSLMNNPQRLAHEYARRLQSFAQPSDDFKRLNLDKQLHQCRRGMSRLIDAYTGGFLDKDEFEPRIAHLKERRRALENEI